MGVDEVSARLSPQRCTIVLKSNPLDNLNATDGIQTAAAAGEIAANQQGIIQAEPDHFKKDNDLLAAMGVEEKCDGETAENAEEKILIDAYGRPLLDRQTVFLPDPRYKSTAHLVFCLLWYGGCLAAWGYIIWVFLTYSPEQTISLPTTHSLDPRVPLSLGISCTGPTSVTVRIKYTDASSPCYNASLTNNERWLRGEAKWPLAMGNNITSDLATLRFSNIPLCVVGPTPYNSNDQWPDISGVAVQFDNIDDDGVCALDVYSELPGADAKPIKRLSVEGQVMKTFFIGYYEKRLKHEGKRLEKQDIFSIFYELDGVRLFGGQQRSSIVALRFAQTANSVMEYDMRSWVQAGGIFGTLWYMISNYFCFWAAPILLCSFPRDFMADAKAGKLDGYTVNALNHCWRPTVWLWIGGELIKRITFATA